MNNRIKEQKMLFHTCTLIEDRMYAFTSFGGFPIRIELSNGRTELIEDLKRYSPFVTQDVLNDGESIFALELSGNYMLQYCMKDNICRYFDIDCAKHDWDNYAVFTNYGGSIYIFPKYADTLVKIDIQTGNISKNSELYTRYYFDVQYEKRKKYFYFKCGCRSEQIVWLYQEQKNMFIAYDLENSTCEEYKLSIKINDCTHIIRKDGALYILSSEGRVYIWDLEKYSIELVADCTCGKEENYRFVRIAVTDKKIYMLPGMGEEIICVSLETGYTGLWTDYPVEFQYCALESWSKFLGYCENEEYYYFAMRSANHMLCINKKNGEGKWLKLSSFPWGNIIFLSMEYNKNILIGEGEWTLNDFLSGISVERLKKFFGNRQMYVGKHIWMKLKK